MAITYVEGSSNYSGGANNITVTKPTGTTEGDVLIAICHWNGNATISDNNSSYPFTSSYGGGVNGTGATYKIFYRVAGSSEPSNYNFTSSTNDRVSGLIVSYRGVNTSNIFDEVPDADSEWGGNTSSTATVRAITTQSNEARVLAIFFGDTSASVSNVVAPTNFTIQESSSPQHIFVSDYEKETAGTIDADSYTFTFAGSTPCASQIFSLKAEEETITNVILAIIEGV
jgi:hypothetical protein